MSVSLLWDPDHLSCLLNVAAEANAQLVLELAIPRQFGYGGCDIPSGWLAIRQMTGNCRLATEQASACQSALLEVSRLFQCPWILTDDLRLAQLGMPFVTVRPRSYLRVTADALRTVGTEAANSQAESLAQREPGELLPIREQAERKLGHYSPHDLGRSADNLSSDVWMSWSRAETEGYARLRKGQGGLQVLEAWSPEADYSPLCAYLAANGLAIELHLPEAHPLAEALFRAGGLRCTAYAGTQAMLLNLEQLLLAAQREFTARLRESRFFQYSGEINFVVGAEPFNLHVLRGAVIEICRRDHLPTGWTTLDRVSFLQAFSGQVSITEAIASHPSPQTLHLLDVILTPRRG